MATYSITPLSSSVNEGSSISFLVSTTGVVDETSLFWTITGTNVTSSDVSATSGTFIVLASTGTFTVDTETDLNLESTEYFNVEVRTSSTTGTVVATSIPIALYDLTEPTTPHGTIGITDNKFSYVFNDDTYVITGTVITLS